MLGEGKDLELLCNCLLDHFFQLTRGMGTELATVTVMREWHIQLGDDLPAASSEYF
jgi:hypothetical protein